MEKIRRSFILNEVESKEDNVVEGYAAVFNQPADIGGLFEERIDPHAFDTCNFDDACLLVNHDTSRIPLARSRRNTENSTLQLSIDEHGLKIRTKLDEKNPQAQELLSALKRGDVNGMSFMFTVEKSDWEDQDKDYPKRTIISISRVYEVSAVTFPAYSQTEIYARNNSLEGGTLENEKKALENARASMLESRKQQDEKLQLEREKLLFRMRLSLGKR